MGILVAIARFWIVGIFFLAVLIIAFVDTQQNIKAIRHKQIMRNREDYYTQIQ